RQADPVCVVTSRANARSLSVGWPIFAIDTAASREEIDAAAPDRIDDRARFTPLLPDHPAYVIYTSGSTGAPKGAINTHRALMNRLDWIQTTDGLGQRDRVLQKTPCTFDVSVWEFLWPLTAGATLVLAAAGQHRDPRYLVDAIVEHRITTAH